jgi:hypothetical protein
MKYDLTNIDPSTSLYTVLAGMNAMDDENERILEREMQEYEEAQSFMDGERDLFSSQGTSPFAARVAVELARSRELHGDMHSPHEAYGIIREELDEFWDEVKEKQLNGEAALKELVQIAAMCEKAAQDLHLY